MVQLRLHVLAQRLVGSEVHLAAEDGLHALARLLLDGIAGVGEFHHAGHDAVVGDSHRRHVQLGGAAHHVLDMGEPVEQRVLGVIVQVDKCHRVSAPSIRSAAHGFQLWCGYARCVVSCLVESARQTRAQLAAPLPFRPLFRSVIFSAAMIPAPRPTVCEQTVSFAWNALRAESAEGRSSFLGVTRTTQDPPIYEDHLPSKNLAEIAIVSSARMQNLLPDDPQPSHISPDIR